MTPRVSVLPAADRDIDGQAEYLMREASLETALRFHDAAAATFESQRATRESQVLAGRKPMSPPSDDSTAMSRSGERMFSG